MSSTFSRKSGDFGGDTGYLMSIDDGFKSGRRSSSFVWWIGAIAVCLVLLLLSVILVAHNTNAINRWDAKYENLISNLTRDQSAFKNKPDTPKDEPDQQKLISSLTQDRDALRSERDSLKQEREALKEERESLKSERHQLQNHTGDLTKERNALRDERTALKEEQKELKSLSSSLTTYKDALQEERDALRNERGALKNTQDPLKCPTLNLTDDRNALRDERDALRVERDQLKMRTGNLTKKLEDLQSQYHIATGLRDRLQEELNTLKLNQTNKTCLAGWSLFNNRCYYFSGSGQAENWQKSREDCQARGGDLAMPKTKSELTFVSKSHTYTWIGLSDQSEEGVWQWVDGTYLDNQSFWKKGEPNNSGNEDCVEVAGDKVKLNDATCDTKFSWACQI
ncbi:CD209 antigen-like [Xyrichtys novacula]|uniref:CD209 antigen-like n=1 Tax=Xyrichtys novacula TaxID=13765 RepID=A0AAV1FMZ4_XYRNO|nr:CD209 antigen-like [Xyrichtys novacula]